MKPAANLDRIADRPPAWMTTPDPLSHGLSGCAASDQIDCHALARAAWGLGDDDDDNSGLTCFAYLWRRFGPPVHGCDGLKDVACYYLGTPRPGVYLWVRSCGNGLAYGVGVLYDAKVRAALDAPRKAWAARMAAWAKKNGLGGRQALYGDKKAYLNLLTQLLPNDSGWPALYGDNKAYRRALRAVGRMPFPNLTRWRTMPSEAGRLNRAVYAAMRELLRPVYVRDAPINILGRAFYADVLAGRA